MPAVMADFTVLPLLPERKGVSIMVFRPKLLIGAIGVFFLLAGICDKQNPVDENPPDSKPSFGAFQISLVPPEGTMPGMTSLSGRVNDGPTPSTIIWEEQASSGYCKLLTPRVPFCSEPCLAGVACVEDDSCQPYPSALTAGTVTVNGAITKDGATSFTMDPINGTYQPVGIVLSYPPFSEGAAVTITAAGATAPAINLTGKGIVPLEILNDSIVLEDNKPVTVQWTPPTIAGISTISIMVDISHHGGTKGKIEVECPDNGSVIIPATLIDQLKALGYFGFPKMEITRRAVTRDTGSNVELVIESKVTKYLHIPGLISCDEDDDCPEGQTCEYFRCK
jgi:hypothetical protein